MKISGFVVRVVKSITVEKIVRFAGRRAADVVFYSVPVIRDPKITAAVYVTHRVTRFAAEKCKRIDTDPRKIFEDYIDAVTDAY